MPKSTSFSRDLDLNVRTFKVCLHRKSCDTTGCFKSSYLKLLILKTNQLFVRTLSIHRGREFIEIAGNSNFNLDSSTRCLSFDFRANCAHARFPAFFSRPLCMLFLSRICCYSPVFSVTKMNSDIVYAKAQAAILRSSGHSVKEIAKFFNKTVRWVN